MEESTQREKVLKRIRRALLNKLPSDGPQSYAIDPELSLFVTTEDSPELAFAQQFSESGGKFFFCTDHLELAENLAFLLAENKWEQFCCFEEKWIEFIALAEIKSDTKTVQGFPVLLSCEALLSRTGSIIVSSAQTLQSDFFFTDSPQIFIAYTSQLVSEFKDAVALIREKYESFPAMVHAISNPAGADYLGNEAVFQTPLDIYVFLVDDII